MGMRNPFADALAKAATPANRNAALSALKTALLTNPDSEEFTTAAARWLAFTMKAEGRQALYNIHRPAHLPEQAWASATYDGGHLLVNRGGVVRDGQR